MASNTESGNESDPESTEFEKKLRYNLDRFAKILLDEQQESSLSRSSDQNPLIIFLEENYGPDNMEHLRIDNFQYYSPEDQRAHLQHFLDWFRQEFPYFRDKCDHCQAKSCKYQGNQTPDDEEKEHSTFIDNTETYVFEQCHKITRFPRYLAATEIARRRRGRCSEYSVLLFRILRALGHQSRWIVDWANHVWAEVWMEDDNACRWVHLDPCEASMDAPLLYQGWGKKQTYIIAFEASLLIPAATPTAIATPTPANTFSLSDVTQSYTSDDWEVIQARRSDDGATLDSIKTSLQRANKDLEQLSLSDIIDDQST